MAPMTRADVPPFAVRKIGHVVLRVTDLARSVDFYTRVLGFKVSDVYPEDMMPGGMVFMRFGSDHHGVALVGGMEGPSQGRELHHFAFEVATLDEVFRARRRLRSHRQWDWAHTLEEAIDRPVPGQQTVLSDPSLRDAK